MEAHIMQDDGRNNQYYYKKAELLEEVYEVVDKELNIPICKSTLDYEIRKVKNVIIIETRYLKWYMILLKREI